MRFRVLGPVEVVADDGEVLRLPRRQERCLLGVLLLEAGRAVPVARLRDLLWDDPPETAAANIRTHAARIRALLARAGAAKHGIVLAADQGGYRLKVDPDTVDAHRFRRLVEASTAAGELAERDQLLREALKLWREPPLDRAASEEVRARLCADLQELRWHAVEESLATQLSLGRHADILPELARRVAEHPTRERLIELHMLALYRAGRRAEALAVYRTARTTLAHDLGLDPGPTLQKLHGDILRDAPSAGPPTRAPVPAQLPFDIRHFVGRRAALELLDRASGTSGGAIVISAVLGTAGVGKTALAIHWAHRVRHRFPDGQLYVNLRGFDTTGAVMVPAEAVRRLLDSLGVPPERVPADLEAQAALYRSRMADRKMLVLLDNARDAEQVRPLLPGSSGCLTLVTSRNQLTGLVASHDALPLTLDLLSHQEARDLLTHRLGRARTDAEPEAVNQLVQQCARLPLALAIAAAQAATQPHLPLRALVAQLHHTRGVLDTLSAGDAVTDVRTVFSWSYRTLTPDTARLFRLLGLHPGPDITAPAAASLAGVPSEQIAAPLARLSEANLLAEHTSGRYALHDLLRAYAVELADTVDTEAERSAATNRMLDHYLHTAHAGAQLIEPNRRALALAEPSSGTTPERPADEREAAAWFTAERAVLRAAVDRAAAGGHDTHVVQLAWATFVVLTRRGDWRQLADIQLAGAAAAARLSDAPGEAGARRYAAHAFSRLGRFEEARTELERALALCRSAGNVMGEGLVLQNLAALHVDHERFADALRYAGKAYEVLLSAGNRRAQADALDTVAWSYASLDQPREALAVARQALAILNEVGDVPGQAAVLRTLGLVHHKLGEYLEAVDQYERAVAIHRRLADRYEEARTLERLGDVHDAAGDTAAARDAWHRAHQILTGLGHSDAAATREKLDELDTDHH